MGCRCKKKVIILFAFKVTYLFTKKNNNHDKMQEQKTIDQTGMNIPELLAPAGNFAKLVTAIHYGADAVYLGGHGYSLRARAGNFDQQELVRAVGYARDHGVKVFVTVNIFAHNRDLDGLGDYLLFLEKTGVDALIIADPGIFHISRQVVPDLPVHISTQANITNFASVRFWQEQGACRVNMARELGIKEINQVRLESDIELEVFVHGAICISYSGRCSLSDYFSGRDANHGDCAHPCRYSYRLMEEKRPGQYFPVEEDERGTYIFNSSDLCLLERLPELVAAGIDSVKIEGRMKSVGYVGSVVRIYRAALDEIKKQILSGMDKAEISLPNIFHKEIRRIGTRGRTENFFDGSPSRETMLYDAMRTRQEVVPVGIVAGINPLLIDVRNPIECGEQLEYLGTDIEPFRCVVVAMETEKGVPALRANPGNRIIMKTEPPVIGATVDDLFQKEMNMT
jgi:putative protease